MQVREIPSEERGLWNRFVAESPSADLLQSYQWGELKQRSGGWVPVRLAVECEGKITAAVSILKREFSRLGKCILYAPRGPVCDYSDGQALLLLLDAVRERARKDGAILFKIDPPIPADRSAVISALEQFRFVRISDSQGFGGVQPRCVMQLDLRPSVDELLADCKPKWRYNIRLAERKGIQIRQVSAKSDLRTFYDLLVETAQRDGFRVRGYSYYEHVWDILVEVGYARLFLAEYEGAAIAGALVFVFGDKCWYVYGASSNSHRNVMPNHLLQWRMIEWAKASGCMLYDFRGVSPRKDWNPSDRLYGLNRFKAGFGARFVEYIGEWDLPFSPAWYWLWTTGSPRVAGALRSMQYLRSGRGERRSDSADV